jgi:hypothetical protein
MKMKLGEDITEKGDDEEVTCCIFCLEGVQNKNAVRVKHLGNVELKSGEMIRDTCLKKIELYNKISAYVMACNISHTAIISSKKQPLLSICIVKDRPLKSIKLFRLFLFFTNQTEVKSAEEFLKKKLYGKFTMEAEIDGHTKEIDFDIEKFPGNEELINNIENFLKTDEMKELIDALVAIEDEKKRIDFEKEYGRWVNPTMRKN